MAISVVYNDVAPGAMENSTTTASFQTVNSSLSRFKDGLLDENYGTFEENFWLLDGSFSILPDDESSRNISCWSNNIADDTGTVSDKSKTIVREYDDGYYTSSGITVTFDTFNNEYPSSITVQWLKDETTISTKTYAVDSPKFFCENFVELYNKIIITFNQFPKNRRLRVSAITDGTSYTYTGENLKDVSILQEVSPISVEIPESTLNCSIFTENISLRFQNTQPIYAYYNGNLLGEYFIKSAKQESTKIWTLETTDYIGALETIQSYGGNYNGGITFDSYLQEILGSYYKHCEIENELKSKVIKGYIGITTVREAFTYACFAVGACVSTANSNKIKIFTPKDTVKLVNEERIFYGGTTDINDVVTRCDVFIHYTNQSLDNQILFDKKITEKTTILFDGGYTDITFKNCTVVEHGANYAIVIPTSATENVTINGCALSDFSKVISKSTSDATAITRGKKNSVTSCPFVSDNNASDVLDRVFNYYSKNQKLNVQIVIDTEQVGDMISIKSPFGETLKGRIISMDLSGAGKLIGQAVILVEVR